VRWSEQARNGEKLSIPGMIDMHGHIGRYGYPIFDLSVEGMVEALDDVGFEKLVISHMQCMSTDVEDGNREVYEAIQKYPERLLGYMTVFPSSAKAVREQVERWLKKGFVGFKLHNANEFNYCLPEYEPVYEIANQYSMPILFHSWGKDIEFALFRRIAKQYPDLSVLMAHSGSTKPEKYIEISNEYENVFLDTALSVSPRGMIERFVKESGAHKVIFGSDLYFFGLSQQLGKIVGANISDEDMKLILAGNAQKILSKVTL
jgi:predicted TIM-barrel fold metal-dependent hydrolase